MDGTIYCLVVRDAVTRVEGVGFDLIRNKYFLLIAAGTSLKGTLYKMARKLITIIVELIQSETYRRCSNYHGIGFKPATETVRFFFFYRFFENMSVSVD